MIVVDSNTVISCFKDKKSLPIGTLVAPDDLIDEYLIAQTRHGENIPGVQLASNLSGYDDAYYLQQYSHYLNSYKDVSFVQMRGFADISILALVKCLVNDFGKRADQLTLDLGDNNLDKLTVVTDDGELRTKLSSEFSDQINIIGYSDF